MSRLSQRQTLSGFSQSEMEDSDDDFHDDHENVDDDDNDDDIDDDCLTIFCSSWVSMLTRSIHISLQMFLASSQLAW